MKDTTFARTFPLDRLQATETVTAPRRNTHGSCAWSLPSRTQTLRQPQDGAAGASVRSIDGRTLTNPLVEAEDARLNGTLRSLARRVRGLNVMQSRPTESLLQTDFYFAESPVIAAMTPLPATAHADAPVQRKAPAAPRARSIRRALQPQVA